MKIKSSEFKKLIMEATQEVIRECNTCGCGDAKKVHMPPKELRDGYGEVPGDEAELKTMDTANLEQEGVDYKMASKELASAWVTYRNSKPDMGKTDLYSFAAGWNAALHAIGHPGDKLNEMTDSGAVFSDGPTIRTPGWVSKKGYGSPGALAASEKLGYKKADDPKGNKK